MEGRDDHPARLQRLLAHVLPNNPFYNHKFRSLNATDLQQLPFTTKAELVTDQTTHPPYGTNLTAAPNRYTRFHQTSGTSTGRPLCWLDTPQSWDWVLHCWQRNFSLLGLTPQDRLFFPFSFGPFLGFWSAFEAATKAGFLAMPGGGMSSTARLRFLLDHQVTVVFATPTYALHLAELAAKDGIDLAASGVRAIVVAGEPGGSISTTRQCIEKSWGARVYDHYGLTEVGPVAIECEAMPNTLLVLESEYIVEVIEANSTQPVVPGELGELVVTNLGRMDSPLIRYRTGDLVRVDPSPKPIAGVPNWLRLQGGIQGRADDMIHVRGNNVYPTAIEAIIRRFPEIIEFRVVVDERGPLSDLRIEIEPADLAHSQRLVETVARVLRDELLFRAEVTAAPPNTLPRFEMKARRVIKQS